MTGHVSKRNSVHLRSPVHAGERSPSFTGERVHAGEYKYAHVEPNASRSVVHQPSLGSVQGIAGGTNVHLFVQDPYESRMTIEDVIREQLATSRKWANDYLRRRCPAGLGRDGIRMRWHRLARRHLVQRDSMRCALCGAQPDEHDTSAYHADGTWPSWLHVDHIVPLDLRGDHHIDNMRLLCAGCNSAAWEAAKGGNPDEALEVRMLRDNARRDRQRPAHLSAARVPAPHHNRPAATQPGDLSPKWYEIPLTCTTCKRVTFRPPRSTRGCTCGGNLRRAA